MQTEEKLHAIFPIRIQHSRPFSLSKLRSDNSKRSTLSRHCTTNRSTFRVAVCSIGLYCTCTSEIHSHASVVVRAVSQTRFKGPQSRRFEIGTTRPTKHILVTADIVVLAKSIRKTLATSVSTDIAGIIRGTNGRRTVDRNPTVDIWRASIESICAER